jgi:hypothetical protein
VQTVIDSGLYIDYGLFSGLAAKSGLRELLDEFYDDALSNATARLRAEAEASA